MTLYCCSLIYYLYTIVLTKVTRNKDIYKDWLVNLTLIEQLEKYNFEIDYSLLIFVPVSIALVGSFIIAKIHNQDMKICNVKITSELDNTSLKK